MSKAKLDKVFSEYIRLRDSIGGQVKCISCGQYVYWRAADAGHFINRKHMSLRFSEINVNGQCRKCNRFDEGNMEGYRRGLIKKYGEEIIDKLYAMKNQPNKISQSEYSIAIKHYKREVERLKKNL